MENVAFVVPGAVAGMAYPRTGEALAELRRLGFRSLVSLSEPVPALADLAGLVHLHCPLADSTRSSALDLHRVAAFVERAPRPIAIHGEGGVDRTAMALACVLVALGRTAAQAVAEVRAAWPGALAQADMETSVGDYEQFRRQGVRTAWFNFAPASPFDRVVHGSERPAPPYRGETTDGVAEWSAFMVRQGIRGVLCLLDESQLAAYQRPLLERYRRDFLHVTHVAIDDHWVPSPEGLAQALDTLRAAESERAPVVVHCMAGMGRTGLILAAWLRARHGLGVDEAIAAVRTHAGHFGALRNPVEAGKEAVVPLLERVPPGARR